MFVGLLTEYIENEFLKTYRPKKAEDYLRKYYPTKQDLHNHIASAIAAQKIAEMTRSH